MNVCLSCAVCGNKDFLYSAEGKHTPVTKIRFMAGGIHIEHYNGTTEAGQDSRFKCSVCKNSIKTGNLLEAVKLSVPVGNVIRVCFVKKLKHSGVQL